MTTRDHAQGAPSEPIAWLYEMAFYINPSDEEPFRKWKQVVTISPPPTIPEGGVRNILPLYALSSTDGPTKLASSEPLELAELRLANTFNEAQLKRANDEIKRLRDAAQPAAPLRGREIEQLREWKSAILEKCKRCDGFDSLEWGGDKEGWGFIHYFIGHLNTRALSASPTEQ